MREWASAGELMASAPGTAMIIGRPSSGKTTLTAFLANTCYGAGLRTAIVDGDIGQSDIGPPATVGMSVLDGQVKRMSDARLTDAYFVGSNSPQGHMPYTIEGTRRMVDRARSLGAAVILVDTTGLVEGSFGQRLKQAKYGAILPEYVIGIQESGEIEHILRPLESRGARVLRLPSSPLSRSRSREERRVAREAAFRRHFSPATESVIEFERVAFRRTLLGSGRPLDASQLPAVEGLIASQILYAEAVVDGLYIVGEWQRPPVRRERGIRLVTHSAFRHLLVGLTGGSGEFMAEGTILDVDYRRRTLAIASSLSREAASTVATAVFGSLKVTPDGREAGRIFPGEV